MARHKKIVTEEQGDPEMNISSMIDCCFLLLIYFLVATSLVSEKKLDMSVPGNAAAGGKPPVLEPGRIAVDKAGAVQWGTGASAVEVGAAPPSKPARAQGQSEKDYLAGLPAAYKPGTEDYKAQRRMETLVDNLKELRDQAQMQGPDVKPIVLLSCKPSAPHQRVVDVMAALAEAGINTVGISTEAND